MQVSSKGGHMAVNETLRQHYLKELGITPWYPRFVVGGAALPHAFVAEAPAVVEAPPVIAPAADTTRRTPAVSAGVTTGNSSASAIEPFAFTWLSLDDRLSVLVQQPADQRGRLPVTLRDMLLDILKALDPAYTRVAREQVFQFHWPLDAISAAADVDAAAQAVDGFMQQRLRQTPSRYVLMLVDGQPRWLMSEPRVSAPVPGVIRLPSLGSMKADPALKKPAWNVMRKLIESLGEIGGNGAQGQQ